MTYTYQEGYNMARKDLNEHGFLHAADKAEILDGDVGAGYNDALSHLASPTRPY